MGQAILRKLKHQYKEQEEIIKNRTSLRNLVEYDKDYILTISKPYDLLSWTGAKEVNFDLSKGDNANEFKDELLRIKALRQAAIVNELFELSV